MKTDHIRNFSIIAHIDHGKSTLADRMLEITNTVEKRKMQNQVLDSMDLERERGITIKMQPVRMVWSPEDEEISNDKLKNLTSLEIENLDFERSNSDYELNLIDTPGHVDFAYEVSRALQAVEGTVLLVDATQGVQAQTFSTLREAQEQGLTIIPVVSKIDSQLARVDEVKKEVALLLDIESDSILEVSGRTGEGVKKLLEEIIEKVPSPNEGNKSLSRGLIFDFEYSDHQGAIIYVRVIDGSFKRGEKLALLGATENFTALEVGVFAPERKKSNEITSGSIGYIVTGMKKPGLASVGDTVVQENAKVEALPGYMQPHPVVWASVYPEDADDFITLRQALERLRLTDASLTFEEETSGSLGRGFRCGFLGMLHLEIIGERLKREFKMTLIVTTPSVQFDVINKKGEQYVVYIPTQFPDHGELERALEPWVFGTVITPREYVGALTRIFYEHEGILGTSETFGNRTKLNVELPLRELYRNLFDEIKSVTSGYASLSYTIGEMRKADVTRMNIVIGDEVMPAFSRVVSLRRVQEEAEAVVDRLQKLLPRQQFAMKVQASALGRVIASRAIKAFRKDVTAKLYGGDVTRKRKLLEKQKKGKKKLKGRGSVNIPSEIFMKMMRPN